MGWRFHDLWNNPATVLHYNGTLVTWCRSKDFSFLADFIIGSPLRKWARDHRVLRDALWRIDFVLFWTLAKVAKSLPVDVASGLEGKFGEVEPKSTKLIWKPQNNVPVEGDAADTLMKLLDVLDDLDDVQNVYDNSELSAAEVERLSS